MEGLRRERRERASRYRSAMEREAASDFRRRVAADEVAAVAGLGQHPRRGQMEVEVPPAGPREVVVGGEGRRVEERDWSPGPEAAAGGPGLRRCG